MSRKRHSDEDVLKLLREIEVKLSAGSNISLKAAKSLKNNGVP